MKKTVFLFGLFVLFSVSVSAYNFSYSGVERLCIMNMSGNVSCLDNGDVYDLSDSDFYLFRLESGVHGYSLGVSSIIDIFYLLFAILGVLLLSLFTIFAFVKVFLGYG